MEPTGNFTTLITSINRLLERRIIFFLPAVLILGIILQQQLHGLVGFVPSLFMYLTFVSSMNVFRNQFQEVWRSPKALILLLVLFHVLLPMISYELIFRFYQGSVDLKLGLLLAMIMPIGVTSIVWVSLAKGNVGIAVSMVTLDTLLCPLLIPLTLWMLVGKSVDMDALQLIWGVVKLIVVPCLLGMAVGGWIRQRNYGSARITLAFSSKLTLYIIVLLNAAAMASSLSILDGQLIPLFLMVSGLMVLGYVLVWISMLSMHLMSSTEIAFTYSGSIRNYTAGIVIAQLFFSTQTAIPVMFAILLQHPLALLAHTLFIKRMNYKNLQLKT